MIGEQARRAVGAMFALAAPRCVGRLAQQLGQTGDVDGEAPRFASSEQTSRRQAAGFFLEIECLKL
jgi:hypothetical protein